MSRLSNQPEIRRRQGLRAGIVSRLLADGIDLIVFVLLVLLGLVVVSAILALFTRSIELVSPPQSGRGILAMVLLVAYLGYGWGLEGRTFGKAVMGLRVVGDDGSDISPARGLARAALCVIFLPGVLWAVVSHRNASLQDLALRTSVIYDWGFVAPPTPAEPVGAQGETAGGPRGA